MNTVTITGNTFPVKEKIKALAPGKVRWNPEAKGWDVPAHKADAARAIVASAGVKKPYRGQRRASGFSEPTWRGNGCSACRARQDWCPQCAFDEFDN